MENSSATELLVSSESIFQDPVSNEARQIVQVINYVALCGMISLLGIGGNIINISVFARQGFKDSINISLMGLAVSDLACSISMLAMSFFYNPLVHQVGLPLDSITVSYITAGWPHVCVTRITSFITAFITLERCLSIAMPLKVKIVITSFRTKVIIISIFISVTALFCPFFFVNKLEWKFSVTRNMSILGVTFTRDRETVESITSLIHSVFLSSVLLICVAICTIILVVELNRKAKWRQASVASSQPEATSVKENKVAKMIVLIGTIFVVCYIPPTVIFLVMVFFPEFTAGNKYENTLYVVWSGPFVLDAINSSVNIFMYVNMSSKYRVTLREMVGKKEMHKQEA